MHPIGMNLRRLRHAKGHSQEQVAAALNVSIASYRNYEADRAVPPLPRLLTLANFFTVNLDELVNGKRRLLAVRFRADHKLNTREQIIADVEEWLSDYRELEELTGKQTSFSLGRIVEEHPEMIASAARNEMGIGAEEPVSDICGRLERSGIKVLSKAVNSDHFFGLAVTDDYCGPAIAVNTWERIPVERWIFSAAHELGHLLLHQDSFDVSEVAEVAGQEKEANVFASCFLMPPQAFINEWEATRGLSFVDRVMKVKRIFHVSYKTVLYRLFDLTEKREVWSAFSNGYSRRYQRTLTKTQEPDPESPDAYSETKAANEPKRLEQEYFISERFQSLIFEVYLAGHIGEQRASELLRIPLGELPFVVEDYHQYSSF